MSKATQSVSKLTLEEVHGRFREWRKKKEWHDPIPEELWDAAVELTKEYSPIQVCQTLRLDNSKFKERVHAAKAGVSPSFIELDFPALPSAAEYTVEVDDTSGIKMRICIKGQAVDVVGLAKAFWSRES